MLLFVNDDVHEDGYSNIHDYFDDNDKANESVVWMRCMQRIWGSVIKCWTGKSEAEASLRKT